MPENTVRSHDIVWYVETYGEAHQRSDAPSVPSFASGAAFKQWAMGNLDVFWAARGEVVFRGKSVIRWSPYASDGGDDKGSGTGG